MDAKATFLCHLLNWSWKSALGAYAWGALVWNVWMKCGRKVSAPVTAVLNNITVLSKYKQYFVTAAYYITAAQITTQWIDEVDKQTL